MAQLITTGKTALLSLDLQIGIYPREYTFYRGTAAQLIAEGLLPPGFKWPTGATRVTVEVGQFTHSVCRCRPDGHKGPKSTWTSGDYWHLLRQPTGKPLDGGLEATIYARTKEIDAALYRRTPEFARLSEAAFSALRDDRYQAFRGLFLMEHKRGRGRPQGTDNKPATFAAQQSQGASA